MNEIKEKAKELCEKSACHHKCNDTKDCVVEDDAREVIANSATTTEKHFTPSEVGKMTPKEVKENYDLIIQSMKRW